MKNYTFRLFNATWKVKFIDKFKETNEDQFKFGETEHSNNTITIATKDREGKPLADNILELTILHEIVHAILGSGQYTSCTTDEPLVEWIANCLYTLKKQNKL